LLHGADALVLPVVLGQHLEFTPNAGRGLLYWQALDDRGDTWLQASFTLKGRALSTPNPGTKKLQHILQAAVRLSDRFLPEGQVITRLEFDRNWGLGSSSSLYHLVGQWLAVSPLALFRACEEPGSGYDLVAAGRDTPFLFARKGEKIMDISSLPLVFQETWLVHLNQKQDSLKEVQRFRQRAVSLGSIEEISNLSRALLGVKTTADLLSLWRAHEKCTGALIGMEPVQERLFPDFTGGIKSLGAWGGDFIWVAGPDAPHYFRQRGYTTVLPFAELSII